VVQVPFTVLCIHVSSGSPQADKRGFKIAYKVPNKVFMTTFDMGNRYKSSSQTYFPICQVVQVPIIVWDLRAINDISLGVEVHHQKKFVTTFGTERYSSLVISAMFLMCWSDTAEERIVTDSGSKAYKRLAIQFRKSFSRARTNTHTRTLSLSLAHTQPAETILFCRMGLHENEWARD